MVTSSPAEPMSRSALLALIADYARRFPDEAAVADRFATFVAAHPDCFERTCVPGHVTGSAWILSHDHQHFLLTHHRKLGRWLQLGGHADGDPDPARVALREAAEESGIAGLRLAAVAGQRDAVVADRVAPLDLDAHEIPARGAEPAHVHYDVRYLVVAPPDAAIAVSAESLALRWFRADAPLAIPHDESVARLARKARALAGGG